MNLKQTLRQYRDVLEQHLTRPTHSFHLCASAPLHIGLSDAPPPGSRRSTIQQVVRLGRECVCVSKRERES
jgi:hypothetical protein